MNAQQLINETKVFYRDDEIANMNITKILSGNGKSREVFKSAVARSPTYLNKRQGFLSPILPSLMPQHSSIKIKSKEAYK